MELSEFLETLRPEIEKQSRVLSVADYIAWLETQVDEWEDALRKPRAQSNRIKARFIAIRDYYQRELDGARGWV